MKKLLLIASAFLIVSVSHATTHSISNSGSVGFNPSTLTAMGGDTLNFILQPGHTATSVTQATWLAGGSTGDGVFHIVDPGGIYVIPVSFTGTIYYVCQPHIGTTGMKALVNVNPGSVEENTVSWKLTVFPNPAETFITIKTEGIHNRMNVRVLNLLGTDVLPARTIDADVEAYNLPVATLSRGSYFIEIENGSLKKVIRFVKQ